MQAPENGLLALLPPADYKSLFPHLKPVKLEAGRILFGPHAPVTHCYFPSHALISFLSMTEAGTSVAIAMVGREGLIGAAAVFEWIVFPYHAFVEASGEGLQISATELRDWARSHAVLQKLLLRYAHALFTQTVQTAACTQFHIVEQRLCRWLLLARDRLDTEALPFTHESLAQALGTDRVSITRAAQSLRRQGLLELQRGQITILDPKGVEDAGCECYGVIKSKYQQFYARHQTSR